MPTISKFYLHDAATPNTGTMPTGAYTSSGDVTGDATNARTARDATDVVGPGQTTILFTATANQLNQNWGWRRFVSRPLAAHTFATADGNWSFSYAALQSNTNHNQQIFTNVYAWRPSTGAQIGTNAIRATCPINSSTTAQTAVTATGGLTWGAGSTTIVDGDILVFEVYDNFSQGMSVAYTSTFVYDGTTEASTTDCASFIAPPAALTLSLAVHVPPRTFDPIPFM